MTVALNRKNFEIRCPVRADPKINGFNIFWESGSDNKTLGSGQSDGHLRAEVEEVVWNIFCNRFFRHVFDDDDDANDAANDDDAFYFFVS